jgi:exopolysaccharide production protein ExoZ
MDVDKKKRKKLESVQALRGVAILLVLVIHAKRYEAFYAGDVLPKVLGAGQAGVDLFFVISGFIMVSISRAIFGQGKGEVVKFLEKRAFRIYPLYWFYTFLLLPIYFFKPGAIHSQEIQRSPDLFGSLTLYPTGVRPIIWQGWSLSLELYFYLIFAVILLFKEKILHKILFAWGLGVIFGYIVVHFVFVHLDGPALGLLVDPMTLEFIGGGFVALAIHDRSWRGAPALLALGAGCLVGGAFIQSDPNHHLRILLFGIPALMILAGAVMSEINGQIKFGRILVFIGDISYSVYLIHIMVYGLLGRFWPQHMEPSVGKSILFCLLIGTGALGFGALSYRFLEKPLLKWCYKFLPK